MNLLIILCLHISKNEEMERYLEKTIIEDKIYFKNIYYLLAEIINKKLEKKYHIISYSNNSENYNPNFRGGIIDDLLAIIKILKRIKLDCPDCIDTRQYLAQIYSKINDKESAIRVYN